ncbi:MAG TPA: hypothetical protein VIM06_08490 [Rhodanobacter sp.]
MDNAAHEPAAIGMDSASFRSAGEWFDGIFAMTITATFSCLAIRAWYSGKVVAMSPACCRSGSVQAKLGVCSEMLESPDMRYRKF